MLSAAGLFQYFGVLTSCAGLALCVALVTKSAAQGGEQGRPRIASLPYASPIFGVGIPTGYRDWQMVGVSHAPDEAGPSRIKAILGNPVSTGGLGYGEFVDGKAADRAVHEKCAPCHAAGATSKQDFVFTRFAP